MKHICVALLTASVLAAPAAAVIRLQSGFVEIIGTGANDGGELGLGSHSGGFSYYDYSACDHHEDECAGLPIGGSLSNGSWQVMFAENGASHEFLLSQGVDIGKPVGNDMYVFGYWIADRAVRLKLRGGNVYSAPDCRACGHGFDIGAGSYDSSDGRWEVFYSGYIQGSVSYGQHDLRQQYQLVISEVPEPASWAMMLAGFALTGVILRRRNFRTA